MQVHTSVFPLLWFLPCLCKCIRAEPRHPAFETKRNHSEEVLEDKGPKYLLPLAGNETSECAVPWSCCEHEACQLPHGILKSNKTGTLSVLNGYCVTVDEENDILEAGHCLYTYNIQDGFLYTALPKNKSTLNDFICGNLHRTGTLCGKCQDGYYPLAYSYDMKCVRCPNDKSNWWKFVLATFLPLTIFYITVLFLKVNIASSHLQGFLFYSQMISSPLMSNAIFLEYKVNKGSGVIILQILDTLYGIWILDFFRSINFGICLGTDMLQTLALDLIVGAYPLLLLVVFYVLIELYDRNFRPLVIMWKPFRQLLAILNEKWDLKTSLIDAFVTAFLLTNVKFQSVSCHLLAPVEVYHLNATGNWTYSIRLFYDATVPYFGSRHLPYAIVALVMLMLFAILPVLLLVFYPFRWFQKLLNLFPFRWYILHTFVDSFYGSYKDGTQPGTRDCRWFASLFILSRLCTMFIGAYVETAMYFHFSSMILTVVALLFLSSQPFKKGYLTTINASFMLLLALWCVCGVQLLHSRPMGHLLKLIFFATASIAEILPLFYISAIVLHWGYSRRKFGRGVITKLHAWRNGYSVIQ